jgi:hypothetical protein
MYVSECCGYPIVENTESGDGEDAMCGKCYEHSPYYDDELEEEEDSA